jgi:hypothetical protein
VVWRGVVILSLSLIDLEPAAWRVESEAGERQVSGGAHLVSVSHGLPMPSPWYAIDKS